MFALLIGVFNYESDPLRAPVGGAAVRACAGLPRLGRNREEAWPNLPSPLERKNTFGHKRGVRIFIRNCWNSFGIIDFGLKICTS